MHHPKKPLRSGHMEGDTNLSSCRESWYKDQLDDETRGTLEKDSLFFLHQSLSSPCMDVLEKSSGSILKNRTGRTYLDFHGNNVHQVGHGHPSVIAAIKRQLDIMAFCPRRYTNETAIDLAEKIISLVPSPLNKVLFAPAGTLAIGIALKYARAATGRFKTISWWDSFHGASLDAISVGGEALFSQHMGPLLPGCIHVPAPDARINGVDNNSSAQIEYVFEHEPNIGAVIAEPIRCTSVCIPRKAYWQRVRDLCDYYGALLIFDEIPLCLGRTGRMFAFEHYGVVPDVLCIGKGLGGGIYPMAATIMRDDIRLDPLLSLGHYTHEKNPVGSAAALATIGVIEQSKLIEQAVVLGNLFGKKLKNLAVRYPIISDVRGIGMLWALELAIDGCPAFDVTERVFYSCLEHGLSFKISAGNIITLTPPLTITEADLLHAVAILDHAFANASH